MALKRAAGPRSTTVTEYHARKANYLENRRQIFEEKAIDGYWSVPSVVLGPDLAPDVWLAAQGGGPGVQFDEPVTLGLTHEDLEAILDRLRDIETLEADLADIRPSDGPAYGAVR